jgi:hypothetical protein
MLEFLQMVTDRNTWCRGYNRTENPRSGSIRFLIAALGSLTVRLLSVNCFPTDPNNPNDRSS